MRTLRSFLLMYGLSRAWDNSRRRSVVKAVAQVIFGRRVYVSPDRWWP